MSDIEKVSNEAVYHDLASFVKAELQGKEPRADCKLCNSKYKKDAHDLYERTPSIMGVHNLLKEKGEDISYGAVRKHLNNHYSVQDSDSNLKDLADRMVRWEKYDTSDSVLLPQYIKLLNMEFMDLISNRSVGEQQRSKNIELALKISAQIDAFKKRLNEIKQEMKPVEVIFTNLHRIIEVKIKDAKSPEVKRILAEIYEQISRDVGDMPLEGYKEEQHMAIRINRGGGNEEDKQAKYRLTQEQRQALFLKEIEDAKQKAQHVQKQGCGGCRRNKGS